MVTMNTLNVKGPLNAGVDQLIERYVVSGSAVTSKTFNTGVAGNTALVFYLKSRIVAGNGAATILMRLNADSGPNYGQQVAAGQNSTTAAARETTNTGAKALAYVNATGEIAVAETLIHATSGTVRPIISVSAERLSGTTVNTVSMRADVWNNSANAITSIEVNGEVTNGLGIGTELELWCRRTTA